LKNLEYEKAAGFPKTPVIGVDEVGRGCLAGPVVAAAVLAPQGFDFLSLGEWRKDITDSKLIKESRREELAQEILKSKLVSAIARASSTEIDQLNIHHATHLAMVRAVDELRLKLAGQRAALLVDGKFVPKAWVSEGSSGMQSRGSSLSPAKEWASVQAIVKGDQKSFLIACASIIAKVSRDQEMAALEARYPGYGLAVHKGYPTPQHRRALQTLGVTEIHRRSFGPVAELV
jgi:ribonuclease HII